MATIAMIGGTGYAGGAIRDEDGAVSLGWGQAPAVCRSAAARAAGRESMGQWPVGRPM